MFDKFRQSAARGAKSIPFAGMSGGSGGGGVSRAEFLGLNGLLPGAQFDYRKEAGKLWENGIILALIKWKCRRWPEANQIVLRPSQSTDGKPKEITSHPLLDLLNNPSGPTNDYDRSVFEAGMLLSYDVNGNAYAYKQRSASGKVIALRYIPHFQIEPYWPKDGSEYISGYVYRVNGQTYLLPKEDIVHLRDGLDPENERKGLSALGAVLREVCTDNEAATFSAAIMRNGGFPTVIISPKQLSGTAVPMNPTKMEEFKAAWISKTRGDNRGEPFVQTIPVEVTAPGFSPEQLVLDKTRAIPVSRISAAFGIDPMVVGLQSENKTYSNYKEAIEAAYEGCLIPQQRIFDMQMTNALKDDVIGIQPGDYLGRDYKTVRVLQEDQDALAERVSILWESGLIMRSVGLRMIGETFTSADDVYITDLIAAAASAKNADESEGENSKRRKLRSRFVSWREHMNRTN